MRNVGVILFLLGGSFFFYVFFWAQKNVHLQSHHLKITGREIPQVKFRESETLHFASIVTRIQSVEGQDSYLFITKDGKLWWVDKNLKSATQWLEVTGIANGGKKDPGLESGFLAAAFPPGWKRSNEIYVTYTVFRKLNVHLVLCRLKLPTDDSLEPVVEVLFEQESSEAFHFGGALAFGPDGLLYLSLGDNLRNRLVQGPSAKINSTMGLRGTILQFDVRKPGVLKPQVWAAGLRNPWNIFFDKRGHLFVADVGDEKFEEINWVRAGRHYGWPWWEGNQCKSAERLCATTEYQTEKPILYYGRDVGIAIVGAFQHKQRSPKLLAEKIVFADHVPARFWTLDPAYLSLPPQYLGIAPGVLTAIGEAKNGGILAATLEGKVLYSEPVRP